MRLILSRWVLIPVTRASDRAIDVLGTVESVSDDRLIHIMGKDGLGLFHVVGYFGAAAVRYVPVRLRRFALADRDSYCRCPGGEPVDRFVNGHKLEPLDDPLGREKIGILAHYGYLPGETTLGEELHGGVCYLIVGCGYRVDLGGTIEHGGDLFPSLVGAPGVQPDLVDDFDCTSVYARLDNLV